MLRVGDMIELFEAVETLVRTEPQQVESLVHAALEAEIAAKSERTEGRLFSGTFPSHSDTIRSAPYFVEAHGRPGRCCTGFSARDCLAMRGLFKRLGRLVET
jgi:hypothetical protein